MMRFWILDFGFWIDSRAANDGLPSLSNLRFQISNAAAIAVPLSNLKSQISNSELIPAAEVEAVAEFPTVFDLLQPKIQNPKSKVPNAYRNVRRQWLGVTP